MNRSTAARASASTVEVVPPTEDRRWVSVVFLQGDKADEVLAMIDKTGPDGAITHLSQWDFGAETTDSALVNGYVYDEIPQVPTDCVIRGDNSGYALTYNHRFGYVSLLRTFSAVVDDSHSPRPGSPEATPFGLARYGPTPRRGLTL